jgi:allantoate deiminase
MGETVRDRAERVLRVCACIAEMTEERGRITRRFLTPPMHNVHAHLRKQMESLGMRVRIDAVGNLRGLWVPNEPGSERLVIGSHLDTVPNAGAFDGVLGVVIGLEWVLFAQEMNLEIPVEVIGFSEEEGVRFGVPFLGSRAVAGCFDPALLSLQDGEGVSLEDAIRAFGLEPSEIGQVAIAGDVLGFVEIHIEQGPVLDAARLSVAAVSGIVGQTRGTLTFKGQANHAGTTPMHLRRDALTGAAEWVLGVEKLALGEELLVATVGRILAEPNAGNVIPGEVEVTLDCRHADDSVRLAALNELLVLASGISSRRGLATQWSEHLNQPTVPMDALLTERMTDAIQGAGFPPKKMTSGAGHDAMIMATRHPATMLFVRSPGGISHDPSESVLVEDIEASLLVARRFLERVATDVR